MNESQQLVNLPSLYVNGGLVTWGSNTTLSIAAGQCRDSTNTYDVVFPALTLTASVNGVNGLDQGTFAANTMYAVYIIYDSTNAVPPACLLSESFTQPLMPSNQGVTYGAFRLVDCWLTDDTAHFVKIYNSVGNENVIYKQYDTGITVLSGGNSTTGANVALDDAIPLVDFGRVTFLSTFTPDGAGDAANIQPAGATGTAMTITGQVTSVALNNQFEMLPLLVEGVPSLHYVVADTDDALTLVVTGFEFYI